MEYFLDNAFIKILTTNAQPLLIQLSPHVVSVIQGKKDSADLFNQQGLYTWRIFQRVINLSETIDDLTYISHFITGKPPALTVKECKLTRTAYLQYHMECYYIKLISIVNKSCLLVNEVYQLGLPSRLCNSNDLIQMEAIKDTVIETDIKALAKALHGKKRLRNFIDHEGKYQDKTLRNILLYDSSLFTTIRNSKSNRAINILLEKYRKETSSNIYSTQKNLVSFLNKLFIDLSHEYNRRYVLLSQ